MYNVKCINDNGLNIEETGLQKYLLIATETSISCTTNPESRIPELKFRTMQKRQSANTNPKILHFKPN